MNIEQGPVLLKIEDVCLNYGNNVILSHVNAEIAEIKRETGKGQIVGVLGPSGIGKTQLFRIIAGLNKPTSGKVSLNNNVGSVQAGQVGVVAQTYPLFDHRTVLGNLLLAAKRKDKKTAKDRVMTYLEEFDLTDKKYHYPMQLSGGQRQRIAIIQQILCSDHFLLMDEPFSGLDLISLTKVSELIQKVANLDELNTIVIVSHDITTTASVADHLWLIGRDRDEQGTIIPGAKIVQNYDLAALDLCWHPDIITQPQFMQFVAEVKQRFVTL